MAMLRGPQHVFELANGHYIDLVGGREVVGLPIAQALPEVKAQGFVALLDEVYRTGIAYEGRQVRVDWQIEGDTSPPAYVDFVYQPIKNDAGEVSGILVEGIDVTDKMEAEERLRLAQQAGGIGTFEWFPETGAMLVSPTFRHQWGIADDAEVTDQLLVGLIDQRDLEKVGTERLGHSANPLEYVEYRVRRPATARCAGLRARAKWWTARRPASAAMLGCLSM